ncbi:LEF-10 [Helicoverpa armigera SNPV]|nr:LEF-10 [Helicoverpa armigera SNPV]
MSTRTRITSKMSESLDKPDVLSLILKDNLTIVQDTYIILNVIDKHGAPKSMCIGEIDTLQTDSISKDTMSDSSVTSELSSD